MLPPGGRSRATVQGLHQGHANFAWRQHMLHHLAPAGSMALLLANGSMSSNTNNEGEIRKKPIEDDYA
ncbi:MAG: N-6 DNA methylase [Azovibrio sp.]|uniref:N-6 DNA methylase n=1 Tax=Azovibrio sp. TaxID=1872673 RepID=UPI003C796DBA